MSTPTRPFGRKPPPDPLPDATTTYQPLLKRELARRLSLICTTSLAFTSITLLISTLDFQHGPPLGLLGNLVATALMALCVLVVGTVPPLVLRGRAVSANGTYPPTRTDVFVELASSPRTWRTLAYFTASGFGLTLLHVAFINLTEWGDTRLAVLAPTRRNAFRLNERFFYLAFFNAGLGVVFATRDLVRRRWNIKWTRANDDNDTGTVRTASSSIVEAFFSPLNHKALLSTTLITIIHVLLFPLSYRICRMFALPVLRNLPAVSSFTRPLLQGFARTWTMDMSWSRMFALGFKTSLTWELSECSFDYWSVKPIAVSPKAPEPNQVLVAGLHSKDRYFKHHAYLELSVLAASHSPASATRRTALFIDSKTSPTLWNALLRELLMTLGRDYQLLLRRGKPAPPVPAAIPQPPKSTPRTPRISSTPLLRQPILKPSPRALFDRFASDSAPSQTPTSTPGSTEHTDIPSVFLPTTPSPVRAEKKEVVKQAPPKGALMPQVMQKVREGKNSAVAGMLGFVEGKLPREWRVREWWTSINLENVATACIPQGELDVAGIDALSNLIAASLTEDTLGTVQRDIPRVLEALLSFLNEAETYKAELESKLPPATNSEGVIDTHAMEAAKEMARAVGVVQPVITALRTGIGLIAKTFGDRLGVYKFPPPTAMRLQKFMDYL